MRLDTRNAAQLAAQIIASAYTLTSEDSKDERGTGGVWDVALELAGVVARDHAMSPDPSPVTESDIAREINARFERQRDTGVPAL